MEVKSRVADCTERGESVAVTVIQTSQIFTGIGVC